MSNIILALASSASIFCATTLWVLDHIPRDTILVAEEDDCPDYSLPWALNAVVRVDAGHVACLYR